MYPVIAPKDDFARLAQLLGKKSKVALSGVVENAKAKVLSDLLEHPHRDYQSRVFWFVDDKKLAESAARFRFWNKDKTNVFVFQENDLVLIDALSSPNGRLFILPLGLSQKFFPRLKDYRQHCLSLTAGASTAPGAVTKFLVDESYELADTAAEPGYYARRGNLIEIFPGDRARPLRLEFEGNRIERLETFDPRTKQSQKKITSALIIPARVPTGYTPLLSLLAAEPNIIFIHDDLVNWPALPSREIIFKTFESGDIKLDYSPATLYYGNLRLLSADLEKFAEKNYRATIFAPKTKQLAQTLAVLKNVSFEVAAPAAPIGFIDARAKTVILGPQEIFGAERTAIRRPKADLAFLSTLHPGDFVVHIDHGIGRFVGMQKQRVEECEREYYLLEYAEGDKLYVPVEYADKISRYVGQLHPAIHRLHGTQWHQVKRRIQEQTREIASELIKLYAKRAVSSGHNYLTDTPEQIELERSFKYEDTPGQRQVTEEIKRDMESDKVMDRLLVGDVGYGKTEISIRAAYKAVQNGKQVAFLCPTTILAEQHYETYRRRLQNFPVRVEVLSRFKTPAQQKKILDDLRVGAINILIGTHRLLSGDVKFKNLGLIILDEEQRFGVEHKEKLKKMRANVDVLAMTATPIPRTLNFSLSGLRDISLIDTPPPGRQPIDTHIVPYDEKLIAKAVREELRRDGQIYFLHNRVETIDAYAAKLKELIPEAKIGIAHGQLPEKQLSSMMHDFYHQKFNALVCSTIIESGLDIKTVNTLVVDEATRFGLSQLYQLRGRIGRGEVKAQSYFLYQTKKLKGRARSRLEALLEAKELGSGFKLAMRDLEIRGVGNLLGREQHGNINAIGLNLYSRLLHQAISELQSGQPASPQLEVTIDLPLPAFLPKDFMPSEERRLWVYQALSSVADQNELNSLVNRIINESRFCHSKKDLPAEVKNLIEIMEIKLLAQQKRVLEFDTTIKRTADGAKKRLLAITFAEPLNDQRFYEIVKKNPAWERRDSRVIRIELEKFGADWIMKLKEFLKKL